jgi:hypothetical protein
VEGDAPHSAEDGNRYYSDAEQQHQQAKRCRGIGGTNSAGNQPGGRGHARNGDQKQCEHAERQASKEPCPRTTVREMNCPRGPLGRPIAFAGITHHSSTNL